MSDTEHQPSAESRPGSLKNSAKFLTQFVRKPNTVGAVMPSSKRLANTMLDWIDWETAKTVVEYGPGTGAFTKHIIQRVPEGCRFFAVEINPTFVAGLARELPDVEVFEDSVANIDQLCAREGVEQIDAIICGIPWAAFSDDLQRTLLDAMMHVLKPSGQFVTFAYTHGCWLPGGRRFRKTIDEYFSEVTKSRTVIRNVPPAHVYRCRK